MESAARGGEVRTGLFVVLAIAFLIFGVLWIVGSGIGGNDRRNFDIWMDDAGGIRAGDPVRLAGINVGRVESVSLRAAEDYPVLAVIAIDHDIEIRQGASALLISDGLLGSKFLAIEPGPAQAPEIGTRPILGESGASLEEALSTVADLGEDAGALLQETRQTLRQLTPRVERLLERGEGLLAEENLDEVTSTLQAMRQTLQDVGPQLGPLVQRLDGIAEDLEEGMTHVPQLAAQANGVAADLRQALGPDGERLAGTLDGARETLDAARSAFERADEVLAVVGGEEGELQATIRDLRRTVDHLEDLSKTLKERPDRIIRPRRKADRRPGSGPPGGDAEGSGGAGGAP